VEQWLLEGDSLRSIGERTGLSKDALGRHRRDHSPIWLARVTEGGRPVQSAGSVRDRIEAIIGRLERVMTDAEDGRRHTVLLQAAREMRQALETIARITGEIDERPTTVINLATSEEWIEVQTDILTALAPYPDARRAVAAALAPLAGP
jgi:hypothetical protein